MVDSDSENMTGVAERKGGVGELVMLSDGAGTLVIGDEASLELVLTDWADQGELLWPGTVVAGPRLDRLTAGLSCPSGSVARYVRTRQMRSEDVGELRRVTRGVDGRYLSSVRVTDVVTKASPQLAALEIALEAAVQEITQAIADVQDTADEILRLAAAERAGDVYGRRRLLQRMHDELRGGAELTTTDWSSVASMGPDLEVTIEALRGYAVRLVSDLSERRSADDRADALAKLNENDRLGSVLQLLAAAEQSFYLWQLIRIRRVQGAESNYLEQTMVSARAAVAEHYRLDLELSDTARGFLTGFATLRVTEFHRSLSARKLRREAAPLQGQLDSFARARGLQAGEWEAIVNPGVRDALTAARRLGDGAVGRGVGAIGGAGGAVERWASRRRGGPPADQNNTEATSI